MADEVYMDVPAVRDMAKGFGTIGDVLDAVAKVLEGLANAVESNSLHRLGRRVCGDPIYRDDQTAY